MIAHRINGEHAFCVGGWTESLAQDLLKHNVTRMELEDGDWSDLACFDGQVDSVQNLKISGTIKAIDNIHIFKKLKRLSLLSTVKKKYDLSSLPHLESIEAIWQKDFMSVFNNKNLLTVCLHSLDSEITNFVMPQNSVNYLLLPRPKIDNISFLSSFPKLTELRITNCRNITTLNGVSGCANLSNIQIHNTANRLVDIEEILALKKLETIDLTNVSSNLNLDILARCTELTRIFAGGLKSQDLPWELILPNPKIKKILGWWNPNVITMDSLLNCIGPMRKPKKLEYFVRGNKRKILIIDF